MSSKLRIIVTGQLAQYPYGGVTWFYLQYPLGLARLGHDVYYIEDSGQWPYNPIEGGLPKDCDFNVRYLDETMARFGMGDRWAYCFPWETQWFGLPEAKRQEVINSADLLINVSSALGRPEDYRAAKRLAFVDTDPVFTQIKLVRGQVDFRKVVDAHDVHFSYGEAGVPETGHRWLPTRAPVVLSEWRTSRPHSNVFTTVGNWTSFNPVVYNGETYGQKDVEFQKVMELPKLVAPTVLEIAIGPGNTKRTPHDLLRHKGWKLVNPNDVCPDLDSLREYTEGSLAEFSVAKNGYVKGQSGWFSERSARYLAAGRPVVTQETGYSKVLPVGEGLLPFETVEQAASAIREVEGNYGRHSKAARALADEYFDSDRVLSRLVDAAMSSLQEPAATGVGDV